MDENEFFDALDKRFYELKLWFQNNGYMKPVGNQPRSMPKTGYKKAKDPCKRCGGTITWDNYDKEKHPYPDHLDENGDIIPEGCPAYKQND